MNTKTGAVLALGSLLSAGIAHAQNSRFYFGYGDAHTAGLNGHAVGDEISTARNLKVESGAHFKVQVWIEKTGGDADDITAGISTHVAYDRGNAANTGNIPSASLMHHKLAYGGASLGASVSNRASFANWDNHGVAIDSDGNGSQDVTTLGLAIANQQGEYKAGIGSSKRRIGMGGQFILTGLGTFGAFFKIGEVGSKVRLFDFDLTNTLGYGEIYGDGFEETGLALTPKLTTAFQAGTSSYLSLNDRDLTTVGSQLIVQGVPEPSSILALSLGGLVLLRRRK